MRTVSCSVSPFVEEVEPGSATEIHAPPRRSIAVSNDKRVRVEGSKNSVARIFPCAASNFRSPRATGTSFSARSRMRSQSATVRSLMWHRWRAPVIGCVIVGARPAADDKVWPPDRRVNEGNGDDRETLPRLRLVRFLSLPGVGAAGAVRGKMDRAREWFFDVLEFVLEIFAETIPRILRRVTMTLVLSGLVLIGLGVLAVVDPALFVKVAYYTMAAAFVLAGAGLVWIAWRIHELTSALRTLARLA